MSRINTEAGQRIVSSQLSGPALLEIFKMIEVQMGVVQAQGNFVQFSFIGNPEELKEGDLIPEIHLSLRPFVGHVIGNPGELVK